MTPKEVMAMCRQKDVKAVDLRFTDFFGSLQQFTIPVSKLKEDVFDDGLGFDGSSLRGWQAINESDMLAVPQPETAFVDPFTQLPTLAITCNIQDPVTGESYSRDPRAVARKAVTYLESTGIANKAFFGPKAEFFIFDNVRFDQNEHEAFFSIDSNEAEGNRGQQNSGLADGPKLGHQSRYQEGYCPVPPSDKLMNLRNEMMQLMIDCGLDVECQHHEVGTAGQAEIDLKHGDLVSIGDAMMTFKYVVKNAAHQHGKTATFMPKPIFGDNGSGMHTHVSLWKDEQPLFAGSGYAGLSETAHHAIGGLLKRAPALLAFTNPTTNSYKRLVPGYEAPVNLVYSQRNRSAACRIPMYSSNPKTKRVEFRCPDPSCNPYLAFAAMLMAVLDGVQNKISPGEPFDEDLYDRNIDTSRVANTPRSLLESLDALENDHAFLLRGDVFTEDVIRHWIEYKRNHEVDALRLRPHPYEFCMYYDV